MYAHKTAYRKTDNTKLKTMANWIELFKLFWEFLKEIFGMIVGLF